MARMILPALLMALCCAGPLLLLAFGPLVWGLVTANAPLIVVAALLLGGWAFYTLRRRRGAHPFAIPAPFSAEERLSSVPEISPGLHLINLKVPSIHCEGCVDTLREGLLALPGVRSVDGAVERRAITVVFAEDQTDPSQIMRAIRRAGHRATVP